MSSIPELQEFTAMMNRIDACYRTLPNVAATVAVNFTKERFRAQNWVGATTMPWKKRKQQRKRDAGRAILVKSARLKRDVHKILVDSNKAIIGTSKLTGAYARAHNEGYQGNVTVKEHKRHVYTKIKEKYTTRGGAERTRSRKTIANGTPDIVVKSHQRKMKIPMRKFLGASPVMDVQIQRALTARMIRAIKG
jgi:phage gpG-like protein